MILTCIISLCVIGCYFLLILMFTIGFDKLENNYTNNQPCISFSVIIPFRNEANHLPGLLQSISEFNYDTSLFEILLVDDDSTDESVQLIKAFKTQNSQFSISIIENKRQSNSPKKDAITTAIKSTEFKWIISTDADCILPKNWLNCYSNFIDANDPNMVIAPVSLKSNTTFLQQFQLIDFLSMQGATIGGFGIQQPFMANGANLAYQKELFIKLNGFENNNSIASGDDVFLLENFLDYQKEKVLFLKDRDALVTTFSVSTWNALVNQRKRWAAKATHFSNPFTKLVGLLVFVANGISILSLLFTIFNINFIWIFLLKTIIDTILIYKTANFYQQKISELAYFKTLIFYPFFTASIAITSMLSPFEWKDRAFKK